MSYVVVVDVESRYRSEYGIGMWIEDMAVCNPRHRARRVSPNRRFPKVAHQTSFQERHDVSLFSSKVSTTNPLSNTFPRPKMSTNSPYRPHNHGPAARPPAASALSSLLAQANSLNEVDYDSELPQIRFGIDDIERMSEAVAGRGKRAKSEKGEA